MRSDRIAKFNREALPDGTLMPAWMDDLWRRLSEGGNAGRCGWLTDKFGLSWQIIPQGLGEMLYDPDPARSQRVLKAMLQMSKIDLGGLKRAYAGE